MVEPHNREISRIPKVDSILFNHSKHCVIPVRFTFHLILIQIIIIIIIFFFFFFVIIKSSSFFTSPRFNSAALAAILSATPSKRPKPDHSSSSSLLSSTHSIAFFRRFRKHLRHFSGLLSAKEMVGIIRRSVGDYGIDCIQS